jgi:hypothetical protein
MHRPAAILISALAIASGAAAADKITKISSDTEHDLRVATYCIEGQVFVIAIADLGEGGGVTVTQIQHSVDGKVLPMTCAAR